MNRFILIIALAAFGLASCKKCSECTLTSAVIKDDTGNKYYLWADGTVRSLPEGHPADSTAARFGITCAGDLEDCIDGQYRDYCGTDKNNVTQQPYVVSGLSVTDSSYTTEYTYECR